MLILTRQSGGNSQKKPLDGSILASFLLCLVCRLLLRQMKRVGVASHFARATPVASRPSFSTFPAFLSRKVKKFFEKKNWCASKLMISTKIFSQKIDLPYKELIPISRRKLFTRKRYKNELINSTEISSQKLKS